MFLNFPRRRPRQRAQDLESLGYLVFSQSAQAVRFEGGHVQVAALSDHYECAANFPPPGVGYPDDGSIGDAFEFYQDGLDLGRIYVLAPGNEHVLDAVNDCVKSIGVTHRYITCSKP